MLAAKNAKTVIGNGKIGFEVDGNKLESFVTVDFAYNTVYDGNVVRGFDTDELSLFDPDVPIEEPYVRSLDMYTGILKSCHRIGTTHVVTKETFAVRHLPFTSMHTYTIESDGGDRINGKNGINGVDLYHTVRNKGNDIRGVTYDMGSGGMIVGKGKMMCPRGGEVSVGEICVACTIDVNDDLGFKETISFDKSTGRRHILINAKSKRCVIRILTTQMTSRDCDVPHVGVAELHTRLVRDVHRIRKGHVNAWMNVWKHNITVEPKPDTDTISRSALLAISKEIRRCLFVIWSRIRCEVSDTGKCQLIDTDGTCMADADEFLLPLLTLFRPAVARSVLDQRFEMLNVATRLAASHGFTGSMFPARNDAADAADAAEDHVARTATVSIAAWNQYRVTRDKGWMSAVGYPLLKNNADFCVAYHDANDESDVMATSSKYLASIALLFAIEASYEMQIIPNDEWINCFHSLNDAIDGRADVSVGVGVGVYALLPLTAEVMSKRHPTSNLKRSISEFLSTMPQKGNVRDAITRAWLLGSCYDKSKSIEFGDAISIAMSAMESACDPCVCAMFVMMIVTTVGTVRFTGNVTETRFYTERMGFKTSPSCIMPSSWKSVKLAGIGSKQSVVNNEN
jgi:hypothetical protein